MNASHRLEKLDRAAKKRFAKLRSRVSHLRVPINLEEDIQLAWTVIEARNLWAEFLRAYYLSGAISTQTRSSVLVYFQSAKFVNRGTALAFAIQTVKDPKFNQKHVTRYHEPPWHSVQKFLKVQTKVGASNLNQIQSALSGASTFDGLFDKLRNFYAHRCDSTFGEAAEVGVRLGLSSEPELRASRILCSRLPKRPQNIITDWLDDMVNVVDALCS